MFVFSVRLPKSQFPGLKLENIMYQVFKCRAPFEKRSINAERHLTKEDRRRDTALRPPGQNMNANLAS